MAKRPSRFWAPLRRFFRLVAGAIRWRPWRGPKHARLLCEHMGPVYIKFGQIVASSPGVFPKEYVDEFQACLDRVPQFPFDEVQSIVGEELGDTSRALVIEPKPIASASIAQVHAARFEDADVVIKVQRPGIERLVNADTRVLAFAAKWAERFQKRARHANLLGIVKDFWSTLKEELDFRKEAANLEQFNQIMGRLGYADVRAPKPRLALTTPRVLVMERFRGIRIDDLDKLRERPQVDPEERLIRGVRAWFQCVVFDGFFHGDVHAGNLMLLDDQSLGFLDFGIVGRFDDRQRRLITDYLLASATADYGALARTIAEMTGVQPDDMGGLADDLKNALGPMLTKQIADLRYGQMLPEIQKVSSRHGLKMPREFVLITKQLLYFDRYARAIAPHLNVFRDPRLIMSLGMDIQKARSASG
jgi:predicted unusual protein kinase regulating ubiquinone biosynthesis (AarF/ABC1/UbiB family)